MVVRLRLSGLGCRNKPFYRVMAADSRSPRDGKDLEVLGYYNPIPGTDFLLAHNLQNLFNASSFDLACYPTSNACSGTKRWPTRYSPC